MSNKQDELCTIARYQLTHEAQIAKGFLESKDIPVFLADEQLGSTAWHLGQATGGIRLLVPASLAEKATALLNLPNANEDELKDAEQTYQQSVENGLFDHITLTSMGDEDDLKDWKSEISTADAYANVAFKAAVIGLLVPFLPQVYSFGYALKAVNHSSRLSRRSKRKLLFSTIVNMMSITLYVLIFSNS